MSSLPERINLYISSETRTTNNASDFYVIIPDTLNIEDDETFYFNVIQFNSFNNFYQLLKGYNIDFSVLFFDQDDVLYETIKGELLEGNPNINDIFNYLKVLLADLITVSYDKILNKLCFILGGR